MSLKEEGFPINKSDVMKIEPDKIVMKQEEITTAEGEKTPTKAATETVDKGKSTLMVANQQSELVASHYNAIPEMGIQRRNDSRILHLRNMNNWMKSMLIGDFLERLAQEGCRQARVLDLACGKGGDLRKWRIGNIAQIVMTDIADISLQDCRDRYQRLGDRRTGRMPFKTNFIQADLTQAILSEILPADAPSEFDIASCQFALHYSFRSEQCARRMLQNCTEMLRPGGYFIGTVTNGSAIMHYLRRSNGHFANQVCSVSAANSSDWWRQSSSPLFGAEIQFQLEGVVNCPEFLCYFPLLKKMLEQLGMEFVYEHDFPDAIGHYMRERGREAMDLMRRMDALETVEQAKMDQKEEEYGPAITQFKAAEGAEDDRRNNVVGTLSKSEWEVLTMYKVFAFRKLAPVVKEET